MDPHRRSCTKGHMPQSPTLTNWLHLLILGVIWGGTFMFISVALQDYGPITVACARTVLGAMSLLILMKVLGSAWPTRETLPYLIWIGVFSTALPFMLLSWGLLKVPSSFAGISMASVPLFILPIAHFFSNEPLTMRRTIGVLMGFAGVVVLIGPSSMSMGDGIIFLGQLSCLGAALCYAISSIQARNCPPVDPLSMSAVSLLFGSVLMVPLMLIFEGAPTIQGPLPTTAVVLLGLLPTAFATYLRVLIIRSAGSVFMSFVNFLVPLWALFFGVFLLSEQLPSSLFGALALILGGLAVSQYRSLLQVLRRP